jgi:hypothetical protein
MQVFKLNGQPGDFRIFSDHLLLFEKECLLDQRRAFLWRMTDSFHFPGEVLLEVRQRETHLVHLNSPSIAVLVTLTAFSSN